MNLLFIRPEMQSIGGTGIFTKLLMLFLKSHGHNIGLYPASNIIYPEILSMNIKRYSSRVSIIKENWDLIILQNSYNLRHARNVVSNFENIPVIFISHSTTPENNIINLSNLFKIFKVADYIDTKGWGVPEEMCEVLYNPVKINLKKRNFRLLKKPYNILMLTRLDPDKAEICKTFIKLFNNQTIFKLTIVGNGPYYDFLKSIANSNINFVGEKTNVNQYYLRSDIIIGTGRTVLEAISNKKLCIVVGIRGFGGMITPDNFKKFQKYNFSGRVGGKYKEKFSELQVLNELKKCIKSKNITKIIDGNYKLVIKYHDIKIIGKQLEMACNNVFILNKKLNNSQEILGLRPILSRNIRLKKMNNKNEYGIFNKATNTFLGSCNSSMKRIMLKFRGNLTVYQIISELGYSNTGDLKVFLKNLKALWNLKVIIFRTSKESVDKSEKKISEKKECKQFCVNG